MGLNRLKRGYLIQFKRYVDQLTGSSGGISKISVLFSVPVCRKPMLLRKSTLAGFACTIDVPKAIRLI